MKRKYLVLLSSVFLLLGCNKSNVNMPKNPFSDDKYERIGCKSAYNYSLENISSEDYQNISKELNKNSSEEKAGFDGEGGECVSSYNLQEEFRDFEYAYFGRESSKVSQCKLTSKNETANRYSNRVKKNVSSTNSQTQTSSSGIVKQSSTTTVYDFDVQYSEKTPSWGNQRESTVTKYNNEAERISTTTEAPYTYDDELFGLAPLNGPIKNHFDKKPIELLGEHAIYGKIKNESSDRYLIKEGASEFKKDYTTVSGRKYVASTNYYYEGILNSKFHFTEFRFYTEFLILSEAYTDDIPILYLEKPELISYTETKYKINYSPKEQLEKFLGDVPIEH